MVAATSCSHQACLVLTKNAQEDIVSPVLIHLTVLQLEVVSAKLRFVVVSMADPYVDGTANYQCLINAMLFSIC
jgi:hypothetical protein